MRGAWIEIFFRKKSFRRSVGRSPCGERGLKFLRNNSLSLSYGRSPCGERGLKCVQRRLFQHGNIVAPRAGSVD